MRVSQAISSSLSLTPTNLYIIYIDASILIQCISNRCVFVEVFVYVRLIDYVPQISQGFFASTISSYLVDWYYKTRRNFALFHFSIIYIRICIEFTNSAFAVEIAFLFFFNPFLVVNVIHWKTCRNSRKIISILNL